VQCNLLTVRHLIVHADDFGLTPAVTRGILEAHAAGVVTSTSVMVGTPGWPDAANVLRARSYPTLDVGLHFDLLVSPGMRPGISPGINPGHTLSALVTRALTGRLNPADIRAECAAQLSTLQATGVHVTHIDSHRHTHALPGVWEAVNAVAAEHGLHVRVPAEPWRVARTPRLTAQLHRAAVSMSSWRPMPKAPTRQRVHFTGLTLTGAHNFEADLLRTLDGLQPGVTELMVHPGHVDPPLATVDGYTWQRERELAALLSQSVANRLARGDIGLTSFAYI
jgi:chitin disaccharide deacetylase